MPKGVYTRFSNEIRGSLSVQYINGRTESFNSITLKEAQTISKPDNVVFAVFTPYATLIKSGPS